MKIMVLSDGETFSSLDGCAIYEFPDGLETDAIEELLQTGIGGEDFKVLQRFGRGEEYAPGMRVSFTDANATVSDDVAGVVTGVVNGPPIRDDHGDITHIPVFAARDKGREETTIYVAIDNVLGEVKDGE